LRHIPFISPALKMPAGVRDRLEATALVGRGARKVIAPSSAIREALIRNGIPGEKTVLVPHGIEPMARRDFAPGLGTRPVRFAYAGRVNRVKGFHVLLDAFASLPAGRGSELHVIGDAHTREEKRYMRRELARRRRDLPRIFLHGHIPREGLADVLGACDVLVLPSICLEVFGLVVPEAFSVGRPAIVSECGGPEELVRRDVDGLVVERNDARALAEAMMALIDNPGRIREMAEAIRPVRTMRDHVDALEGIYVREIEECSPRGAPMGRRGSGERRLRDAHTHRRRANLDREGAIRSDHALRTLA
jgi:glycosyltransferase involved in cell wall biosynthesis